MSNRIILFATILFLCPAFLSGQELSSNSGNKSSTYFQTEKTGNWYYVLEGKQISAENLFNSDLNWLGISNQDQLIVTKSEMDQLGITHTKYRQFHKGIKVFGAELIIHEKNGFIQVMNGRLVRGINGPTILHISEEEAIQIGMKISEGSTFIWEDAAAEKMLKTIRRDATATFYPKPQLVWYHPSLSQEGSDYLLAYNLEIYASDPLSKTEYFIDAQTGEIIDEIDNIHTTDVPGVALTKYTGTQTITTDSVAPGQYRLRETGRGGGIQTFDMNQTPFYNFAVDFFDSNNVWDTTNAEQDEAATDAHFGAEMTYDYLNQIHNYKSYDNNDALIASYVHFTRNYVNAFWNGTWMTFGDGNGTSYSALTSLDVVAHELTHGVTDYTADLVYNREPGALNESFSDIIGTTVEHFADPLNFDWFIGEDFNITGTGFRSMSYPKSKGDPDTYKGQNWVSSSDDNYGVHSNSGVQNKWFYLLTDGDLGTNDNGDSYNVTGLGIDTAARIAFRNLQYYLTTSSQYLDARLGSIQAAVDLYGACSNEAIQTANAWYAVGVGGPLSDEDFLLSKITSPGSGCGLSDQETVSVELMYNGCGAIINAGDSLVVSFQVDGGAVNSESIILSAPVSSGGKITHTFIQKADLSSVGNHTIKSWVDRAGDTIPINDTNSISVNHSLFQNINVKMDKFLLPVTQCNMSAEQEIRVRVRFEGCTFLPAGEKIYMFYSVNGGSAVMDSLITTSNINAGGTTNFTFTQGADLTMQGEHLIDAWVDYPFDSFRTNDTIKGYAVKNVLELTGDGKIMFLSPGITKDSMITSTGSKGHVSVNVEAKNTGAFGLLMTGENIFSGSNPFSIPDSATIWSKNSKYDAKACFCMDASNMGSVLVEFDLRQTYSPHYTDFAGIDLPEASSMRVLVNGNQLLPTFHPATHSADTFITHIVELDSMAGQVFEWCFQTRNFLRKSYDPYNTGDNSYIDNLVLREFPVGLHVQDRVQIKVYPVPAENWVYLIAEGGFSGPLDFQVINPLGQLMMKGILGQHGSSDRINLQFLPSGLYYLSVKTIEGSLGVFKIVKL